MGLLVMFVLCVGIPFCFWACLFGYLVFLSLRPVQKPQDNSILENNHAMTIKALRESYENELKELRGIREKKAKEVIKLADGREIPASRLELADEF